MAKASEIYEANRHLFLSIPKFVYGAVCTLCLGPTDGHERCLGCHRLVQQNLPARLYDAVIPITVTENPSPWYSRLVSYKGLQPEHSILIAALVYLFASTHERRIAHSLSGAPEIITTVPSTRGKTFEQQPLRRALGLITPPEPRITNVLAYRPQYPIQRQKYSPDSFLCDSRAVSGRRVLLVEDTWVSGAKAMSAAGALLECGSAEVMVLVVAREIRLGDFWRDDLPYFKWCRERHNLARWPRDL